MEQEAFDLEEVYDAEIAPLMTQIIDICQKHQMPMFATFLYMNDPDGDDGSCITNLMPKERPIPDKFLSLVDIIMPRRVPPLHLKLTKEDGSVEHTVILG